MLAVFALGAIVLLFAVATCCAGVSTADSLRERDPLALLWIVAGCVCAAWSIGFLQLLFERLAA
jgi:hypothetical protein